MFQLILIKENKPEIDLEDKHAMNGKKYFKKKKMLSKGKILILIDARAYYL